MAGAPVTAAGHGSCGLGVCDDLRGLDLLSVRLSHLEAEPQQPIGAVGGESQPGAVRANRSEPVNPNSASACKRKSVLVSASIGMPVFEPAQEKNGTMTWPVV